MHPVVSAALVLFGSLLIMAPYAHHAWLLNSLRNLNLQGVNVQLRPDDLSQMFNWYNDACLFAGILMICSAVAGALYHAKLRRDGERLARIMESTAQNTQ